MENIDFIIDGAPVASEHGATFDRRDPMTADVATTAAAATLADVETVVASAAKAFQSWSQTGPNTRRALLMKAADLMESRTADFVRLMLEETGATAPWAGFNVHLAAGMLREAGSLTTQITGEVIPSDKPGILSMAVRQPVGVVLGMAPWNAPVILGTRAVAAALACGNTVVLRSSEACPGTHHLIGQVLNDAGFPPGVVNVISNAAEDAPAIVAALVAHPAIKRINFTGSTKVGRIIARLAAEHLKPVLLELGGKAPFIVLDDADLDQAVDAAAFGAFMNQGQICMSTERIIVDTAVADAFVAKLAAKAARLAGRRSARARRARVHDRPRLGREDGRAHRRCARQGRQDGLRRQAHRHGGRGDAARSRDARHAGLRGGILRPGEAHRPGHGRRRSGAGGQRHGIRAVGGGLRPRHHPGPRRGRNASSPGSATSTVPRWRTKRRCRSAA